ncbi:metal transporter [Streptomyces sp. NRRL WC-3753]|uniref:ABC transporter permease n=1 Tax=Streptomyces sp. CS159 TaxID=1982762 RepID=UPI00031DAF0D|nr:ABC transporter permease [Streptomyces sp. CS159]KPC71842.1 metal transporter [Streptomyces sp. NRRL WC-3753]MZE44727.1 ABC transporter permease subunit [Streptomyces sp. SID5477]OWA18070.1 metal transporter [Streptomyces sp. CS159]
MSLIAFAGRRLVGAAVLLVVLSAVVFAATAVLPGDAVSAVAGVDASAAQRAEVRAELGLDRPAAERYAHWVEDAVRGDLGHGFVGDRPVTDVLATRLPNSLLLAGLTLAVTAPLAALLGLWTGLRGGGADRFVSTAAQILAAVPEFVVAALLVAVLAVWLELLPRVSVIPLGGTPLDVPHALILPVLTLSAVGLAVATRLLRVSVADAAATPYCEAARLNGVRGVRLAVRHILPNAAGPAVHALTLTTGALVGSAVVVENVFDYPGIGRELQLAVAARDIPMVQGIATVLAGVMLVVLLTGDICARLLGAREGHGR